MKEIIRLNPVFKEAIWGGSKLREKFDYDIPSDKTGECWGISAHQNGDCIISSGEYKGKTLSWLWNNQKELFANIEGDRFPLLIKIIDAKADLSIQVHPDNDYAKENENGSFGKTECWYILDCDADSEIVLGHNASTKEELKKMIDESSWNQLIKTVPVKKGDFFQINPGTVHALKGGILILEVQQNSDITYRLYDYDRLEDGKLRELHIDKSIDVINCPHEEHLANRMVKKDSDFTSEKLIENEYYTVYRSEVKGKKTFENDKKFLLINIINGVGKIDNNNIKKGDNFILPFGYGSYIIEGNIEFIATSV